MAYRASTKRSSTKKPKESPPSPIMETPVISPSELSIDDIVGGPKGEEQKLPKEEQSKAPVDLYIATPKTNEPMEHQDAPQITNRYDRPQSGGYSRQFNRYQRPGYGTSGAFRSGRPFTQTPFRRPQRDFVPSENGAKEDFSVPTETVKGILDIMPEGHGFLRPKFTPSDRDVYISQSQIRRFLLRNGDEVVGQARAPKDNERYWGLLKVEKINDNEAETMTNRPRFEDLVPVYPNVQVKLETGEIPLSTRIIDLLSPIGFGQRGLIVSPPKAGKTTILKEIAAGISANYPDVHLMAALIGERPEEVTDLSRSIKGEVLASNFDQSPQEQVRVAEVALDRAKRLVELGKDVVILLDSVTRLARAYNLVVNPSGRTLSGGFDPAALYPAKKFLGAARCVEEQNKPVIDPNSNPGIKSEVHDDGSITETFKDGETRVIKEGNKPSTGGSLTVIGTCLVDTGSRMDDLIYEEFKGTGNMELHLSRKLQERRIFPAIDVATSGTRHDELLLGAEPMKRITTLRHMLALLSDDEQTAMMIERLSKTTSNAEFLESLSQG